MGYRLNRRTKQLLSLTLLMIAGVNSNAQISSKTLAQTSTVGPQYQLVRDFPYEPLSEICEAFTNMLNAFGSKEPLMRCEQKLRPGHLKFNPIELLEQPTVDTFKYFSAIRDFEHRETTGTVWTATPELRARRTEEFAQLGGVAGYKYFFFTTDRFFRSRTATFLVQERQGDCRADKYPFEKVQRVAYEWDANTNKVIAKHFQFQSLFTYEGESLQGPGLLYGYWNEAELSAKPPGKFGSIWLNQADGAGPGGRICTITFSGKL